MHSVLASAVRDTRYTESSYNTLGYAFITRDSVAHAGVFNHGSLEGELMGNFFACTKGAAKHEVTVTPKQRGTG